MDNKYKGMISTIESFSKILEMYNNPNYIQNIVNSLSTYESTLKNFNSQVDCDKLIKNINNIMSKDYIELINKMNEEVLESFSRLFKNDQFSNLTYSSLSSFTKEALDIYNEEIDINDYTEEIVDELSNNVDPNTIAENLEIKTKIPAKTWIEFIIAIIMFITALLGFLSDSPIEINFNEYNIENIEYESESIPEKIVENLKQVNKNITDHDEYDK